MAIFLLRMAKYENQSNSHLVTLVYGDSDDALALWQITFYCTLYLGTLHQLQFGFEREAVNLVSLEMYLIASFNFCLTQFMIPQNWRL